MELRQLEYFCEAARQQHISRAADALFISQPALTKTIRDLERDLEVPLFQKKGRGIQLTSYGSYFYNVVSKVLSELHLAQHELKTQQKMFLDGIMLTNDIPELFSALLTGFLDLYPDIPVTEPSRKIISSDHTDNMGFICYSNCCYPK